MKEKLTQLLKREKFEVKLDTMPKGFKKRQSKNNKQHQIVKVNKLSDADESSFEVNECSFQSSKMNENQIQDYKLWLNKSKKIKKHLSKSKSKKIRLMNKEDKINQDSSLSIQEQFQKKQIIFTTGYGQVKEQDFKIMVSKLRSQRQYSTLLLNQFGNIIYADRLGSEHFQGSLNNFQRNPFHSIIVQKQRQKVLKALANISFCQPTIIKYFIYSKNIKRRYCKITTQQNYNDQDLFFRFLKGLSTKILPIQITFQNYRKYQGYWNQSIVKNRVPLKCFWLQTRSSLKFPLKVLQDLNLSNDDTISKFIKYTRKRQKKHSSTKSQNNYLSQENAGMIENKGFFQKENECISKMKNDEIQSQNKQSIKHSNTFTGKQLFLNSCSKETQRQKYNE